MMGRGQNGMVLGVVCDLHVFPMGSPAWSFQLPPLVAKHRCQTRMACKYIWGEVKELNGEQKTATYKCRPQWRNHSADLLQQERLKNPCFERKDVSINWACYMIICTFAYIYISIYWNYMKLKRYHAIDVEKLHIVMEVSIFYAPCKGLSSPLSGTGWRGARCRGLKGESSQKKHEQIMFSHPAGVTFGENTLYEISGGPLSQTTPMVWKIHNENERPEWMALTIKGTRYL